MSNGKLYLIPCTLGETATDHVLPAGNKEIIFNLRIFFIEEIRSARRFLKKIGYPTPFEEVQFIELNEHSKLPFEARYELLEPLRKGVSAGILSEAGCPGVADPGSDLVSTAHECGLGVVPLVGPSSLLLALMASGMNGQSFVFHGYLPKDQGDRRRKLQEIERDSLKKNQTQIFIETPYRNQHLVDDLLSCCNDETRVCIASNLTTADEHVFTKTVSAWKEQKPKVGKVPTVYLIHRP